MPYYRDYTVLYSCGSESFGPYSQVVRFFFRAFHPFRSLHKPLILYPNGPEFHANPFRLFGFFRAIKQLFMFVAYRLLGEGERPLSTIQPLPSRPHSSQHHQAICGRVWVIHRPGRSLILEHYRNYFISLIKH